ncbi:hypothetical protein [Verrucomicrobium sp. BvORR034]|uniref:ArnT family glycosyltransferase n=1 Tax=Verrucomicrobium sp. BvORR034 TaxID=1396418 RepID=UPI0006786D57|nr:hypothetical protein [Verrucomicrobium sp. BvORR034]
MMDSQDQTSRSGGVSGPSWGVVLVFFAVLVALFFVQLFATFRGISSPATMDAAQVAREIARGNGFHTKLIRPYAWQQQLKAGKDAPLEQMVDTHQPPLPTLLMVPMMQAFKGHWEFPESSRIYPLDRVIVGASLLLFVASIGLAYLTVQRVFDAWIAGWTVILMLLCQYFWEVGRSGLTPMMLLFFFNLALYWLVGAMEAVEEGRPGVARYAVGLGLVTACMVMTHWMALWLMLGLTVAAAIWLRPRALALAVLLPSVLVLAAWGWRNQMVGGDALGSSKAMLQAALMMPGDTWLLRDFSGTSPPVDVGFLLRKTLSNLIDQLGTLYLHLGSILPAGLFFLALLHPFKRGETRNLRWALAIVWGMALVGMSIVGLPEKEFDENQMHQIFIPLFAAYGLAFLTVLWARLGFTHAGWWGKNALVVTAVLISILPMARSLPLEVLAGLYNKGQFAHWPPYLPDRIAKVRDFVGEKELVYTDMPWAVAWYADRKAVWLPMEVAQFNEMRDRSKAHGEEVAGMLFTPFSSRVSNVTDVFSSEYRAWAPEVYRGSGIGLGLDTLSTGTFPYKEIFPLAGQPVGTRFLVQMAFMSDRRRWEAEAAK